ncbi:MAG: hypothetical protein FWE16_02795 [Firmicutes bacterium]|nr:hypothetical protein [Bacillota bacterium]
MKKHKEKPTKIKTPRRLKKRWFVFGALGIAAIVFIIVASVSARTVGLYQLALDNISEARFFMKHAESDTLRVQFFSGIREQNYQMDGVASGTVPFGLLNIDPRDGALIDTQELTGILKVGTEEINVTLERNKFGRNFATDIGKIVEDGTPIIFTLQKETDTVVFDLKPSMAEGSINWEQALKIAVEHLADEIRAASTFEVYVKIITDRDVTSAFWFVQFVTNDLTTHFAVINTDGSIIGNQQATPE